MKGVNKWPNTTNTIKINFTLSKYASRLAI
jgi:hypothetical protein